PNGVAGRSSGAPHRARSARGPAAVELRAQERLEPIKPRLESLQAIGNDSNVATHYGDVPDDFPERLLHRHHLTGEGRQGRSMTSHRGGMAREHAHVIGVLQLYALEPGFEILERHPVTAPQSAVQVI